METTSSDSELEVMEGLQQQVVNGEYKTVYLNDYVIYPVSTESLSVSSLL